LHQKEEAEATVIDTDLFKKYVAYAKQKVRPKLSDEAIEEIKSYYLKMRSKGGREEGGAIPISPRQLEAIVRLAEAAAKIRLAKKVMKKDARRAINLLETCLSAVGIDPETGEIDIDRITSGISATQRSKIGRIKEIIRDLEKTFGKSIPIEEVTKLAKTQGFVVDDIEEIIEKLKRAGDIYEPKRGFISQM
jgi:replicative DNA helicase Mcm